MSAAVLVATATAGLFAGEIEKWRTDYNAGMKAPDGWLSVAGLFWLHKRENTAPGEKVYKRH